jgi:transposase
MIDYHTYCRIHDLHHRESLKAAQIARQLGLDVKTVTRWLGQEKYIKAQTVPRPSKLDPFKGQITRWLDSYPYSAQQIFQRLKEQDYSGGYSILKDFIRQVRPKTSRAFETLHFEAGECAQIDWGSYGFFNVGNTRRRLSFFSMVLCYSRLMYVEFTFREAQEHFLGCHLNALEYFGLCPRSTMVDNCKVAVLHRPKGQPPVFQPSYLDFARHYGFSIKACAVRQPQQKGRVENAVAYIKKNFLAGKEMPFTLQALNTDCRDWLDTIANVRIHGETKQKPTDRFEEEKSSLQPLPVHPYDIGQIESVRASNQYRVVLDTNRYSVPPRYAGQRLQLKLYPDKLCFYHDNQLLTQHSRSYERRRNFRHAEHSNALLDQKRKSSDQKLLIRFLALSPKAQVYHEQMQSRRLNVALHIRRIIALCEIYDPEKVARALEDALFYEAFSSEYITNLLEQRQRRLPEPGALHLTRNEDMLELDMPDPDLSIYDAPDAPDAPDQNPS